MKTDTRKTTRKDIKTHIQKVIVNGVKCLLTENRKEPLIPTGEYKYKYSLRHGEMDWSEPIMIERFVFVNWFGDILSPVPLIKENAEWALIKHWEVLP